MDKKVKRSVEMIKMPDDVKERIIAECEAADKSSLSDNGKYADQVYKIEHVKSHNFRRAVSGIAACAVLAGGIGLSAHLMKKQPSPSSISASPEECTDTTAAAETVTESVSSTGSDDLIEEFLSKEFTVTLSDTDESGNTLPYVTFTTLTEEQRAEITDIIRKYEFTETTEEDFPTGNIEPAISLDLYASQDYYNYPDFEPTSFPFENSVFNIYDDGYVYIDIQAFDQKKPDEKNYPQIRHDTKYYKCENTESLINELKYLDYLTIKLAPFCTFTDHEYIVKINNAEINSDLGDRPAGINMYHIYKQPWLKESPTPTEYSGRTLTQEERDILQNFFNHADYKELTDFTDLPETSTKESISFVYLDDQQMVGITIHNSGLFEYKYIPFTWDKSSPFAVADNERYEEDYYLVDYQEFRDKIVEVLGEEVVLKIDTSYETPPFGHLTDYDLNSYQSLDVDWAKGVPAEAVVSVEAYINAHHWTEVSQPIENAINSEKSENSFVTLYNNLYSGSVECSFSFFNSGYISKLTSDGTETWYKCIEEDDIAVGVDNIITSYTNNNTNNN